MPSEVVRPLVGCGVPDAIAGKIVRDAEASDYSWSSIITGIVNSPAFLRRAAPTATN